MSARKPWLSFERHGGVAPRDNEALALAEDGTFTARRTIGGAAIGSFEGSLSAAAIRKVRSGVEALAKADDLEIPTPMHGATETLTAGGHTLRTGSNDTPPPPWAGLLKTIRRLFESEVVADPVAAVRVVADARSARLEHAGAKPIDIDVGTVSVRVVLMSEDEGVRGEWVGRPVGIDNGERVVAAPRWATADHGWTSELPFDHGLRMRHGDWLQVWVDVAIRERGERRAGQVYVPVLADA